jgi:uncharacterized protein
MPGLRLEEIWIYPIKSLGGIRRKSSRVFEKGLQYDRRWMLVDEDGVFMTQRQYPEMALFQVTIDSPGVQISFRGNSISFPIASTGSKSMEVMIWDDQVTVIEEDARISAWFSQHLGVSCRLVTFPEENKRPVSLNYQVNHEQVSLADAYPFMIIGRQSLADLNRRLKIPLPMNRFRPNLVFSGGKPYEEDGWRNFTIGKNRFVGVKPCARCVITTINQETTERGTEPLYTLSTFRKQDNKVLFGQNAIALDHFEIFENDEITF